MRVIIFILSVILGLLKYAGTICLLVGAILFMVNGVANPALLWTGFGLFVAGCAISGINLKFE